MVRRLLGGSFFVFCLSRCVASASRTLAVIIRGYGAMARDLNKVTLLGRLGGAPELRYTASGQAVAQFSLATNNRYTNAAGEKKDDVCWHRVVVWGKLADVAAKYLVKGSRLYTEGRLQYRKWQDKDGLDRVTAEVIADELIFLDAASVRDGEPAVNGSA